MLTVTPGGGGMARGCEYVSRHCAVDEVGRCEWTDGVVGEAGSVGKEITEGSLLGMDAMVVDEGCGQPARGCTGLVGEADKLERSASDKIRM